MNRNDQLKGMLASLVNLSIAFTHHKATLEDLEAEKQRIIDYVSVPQEDGVTMKASDSEDYLLLKWGSLKGWNLTSERGKELLQQWFDAGVSMSAMLHKDTDAQKELILQMIDECQGSIQNDWSGEYYTKEQAKKYIMTYGNDDE